MGRLQWRPWMAVVLAAMLSAVWLTAFLKSLLAGTSAIPGIVMVLAIFGALAPGLFALQEIVWRRRAAAVFKRSRQKLEQANTRFQVALESSEEGVLIVDANGRVLSTNPRFLELWRVPMELAHTDEDQRLLDYVLDQLQDPEQFLRVVRKLYGSDDESRDVVHFKDGRVFSRYTHTLVVADQRARIWCFKDITQQHEAQVELAERERQFRTLAENSPDNIVRFDCSARVVYANPASLRVLRKSMEQLQGKTPLEVTPGQDHYADLERAIRNVADTGKSLVLEQKLPGAKGEIRIHSIRLVAEPGPDGAPTGVLAVGRDVTDMRRAAENLSVTASVFDNTQEGILISDARNRIIEVNPAFTRITGFRRDEVLHRSPGLLRSGRQERAFYSAMWQSLQNKRQWRGEIWNRRKSGEIYPELLSISVICDDAGDVLRYVAVFSDITTVKAQEAELRRIAQFDALTGIPNRLLLADRLAQSLIRAQRADRILAVCYVDLDGFKLINDRHGHEAGDRLLVELSQRLLRVLRAGDTVARMGGDEFVVLFNDLSHPQECLQVLDRILYSMSQPVYFEAHAISISASIGVTFYPSDQEDADTLLRHADQAMYQAKQKGRNRYHCYERPVDLRLNYPQAVPVREAPGPDRNTKQ